MFLPVTVTVPVNSTRPLFETVMVEVPDPKAALWLTLMPPPVIVVPPLWLLELVRTKVPAPVFARTLLPVNRVENVAVEGESTLKVEVPEVVVSAMEPLVTV